MATAFAYRSKLAASSDSDSDDSDKECYNWKRGSRNEDENIEKIPMTPPVPAQPATNFASQKRKRNTIWSEVLQDQIMSETLNHCGIKNKPKGYGSRGEESYDYTLGKEGNYDDGSDEEMSDESQTCSVTSQRRYRSKNFVELDTASMEAARKIVRVLAEEKRYLIYRVVKYLGIEKAMQLLKDTETIEDEGGMMIKNQARRRTPGGVYLHLVRSDKNIEKEVMDKIFEGELNSYELKKKFNEMRKNKQRHKKVHRGKKKQNRVEKSSPLSQPDQLVQEGEMEVMEEDKVPMSEPSDVAANLGTSDLEEGEVE